MSVSCQYDLLKYPLFLSDIIRFFSVEGEVRLPENLPPIHKITWGSFEIDAPKLTVYDDLLVVKGKVYPHLLYLAAPEECQTQSIDSANDGAEIRDGEIQRREYGARWVDEAAIDYEERITVPGLRSGMTVEVNVAPSNAIYEQTALGQIRFNGQVEAVVHVAEKQTAQVVSEVIAQLPAKVNITKEPVRVEELLESRKELIPVQVPLLLTNLKPGVARILTYQTRPVGVNWEMGRGKIFIRGSLEVVIVYVGCDDEGRPTEVFAHEWTKGSGTAVPFETGFDYETTDVEVAIIPRIVVQNSRLEMRTPREMGYRANLECEVMVSKVTPKEVVVDVVSGSEQIIDTQKYLLNFEEYLGEKTGEISFETSALIPGGENPERLLAWQGTPKGITLETAEEKVFIDGTLDLRLVYVNDSPDSSRLQVASWERQNNNGLPLAGVIEFPGLQSGALLRGQVQVESLNLELVGDRSVQVTGVIKCRVLARNQRTMMTLRDCAILEPVDWSTRPSMLFYIVQPGDSLWKIARQYQITVDTLARINQIANPDRIEVGRKLIIPKMVG